MTRVQIESGARDGRQSGDWRSQGSGGERWLGAVAALMVGAAFLGLWFWLLPGWLGFGRGPSSLNSAPPFGAQGQQDSHPWLDALRRLAAIPSALGFAV